MSDQTHTNTLLLSDAERVQQEGIQYAVDSIPADSADIDLETAGVKAIQRWVGDDADRAQQALDAEQAKPEDQQRSSLIASMEKIAAASED